MGDEAGYDEEGSCAGESGGGKGPRKARQEWRWGRSWEEEQKKGDEGDYEGWPNAYDRDA